MVKTIIVDLQKYFILQGRQNLGMGDEPARKFYSEMRRRNEFEEWGLEVAGGWGDGTTWLEVVYVR